MVLKKTGMYSSQEGTMAEDSTEAKKKPKTTLPGTVEKIIKPIDQREPDKAQIGIQGGEPLYREIRIDNTFTNAHGEEVAVKEGANVDVTIEAKSEDTTRKAK
jgi:hypothetical protein